jgi:hypothetical protein
LNALDKKSGVPLQATGSLTCGLHALVHLEAFMDEMCVKGNTNVQPRQSISLEGLGNQLEKT